MPKSALSEWSMIKQGKWVDKDELDVSVAPSPVHSCLGYLSYKQAHLCCDLPVACAFASSRLKGNGQPGLSCAEACWALHSAPHPPPPPRKAPSSVVPIENSGSTPCCCVIPMPCFSKRPPMSWLAGTHRSKANKLMSQIWAHSEHTVQPGNLTLAADPEIFDGNTSGIVIEDFGKKKKKLIATVIFFKN